MTDNAGGDNAAHAEVPPLTLPDEVTKITVRKALWDYIMKNRLANLPLPVYQRIPNVKGSEDACRRLAETSFFKSASTIKSNPDKPQKPARLLTLEAKKTLLVQTPRLRKTLFTKVTPPEDADEKVLNTCATSEGIRRHSQRIELDESVAIDLVIFGSVAVTRQGYRVGKGDGFFDLEYAMMRSVGAIDSNTPVITTVQDFQVIDLPDSIFNEHDVRVNYIVTPTEVIECGDHSQPQDIKWSLLTEDRLNRISVLKKIRILDFNAGKDIRLKNEEETPTLEKLQEEVDAIKDDDDSEPPNFFRRRPRYNKKSFTRQRRSKLSASEGGDGSQEGEEGSPSREKSEGGRGRGGGGRGRFGGRRRFSRRRRTNSNKENDETGGSEGEKVEGEESGDQQGQRRGGNARRGGRRNYQGSRRRYQGNSQGNEQTEGNNSGNESGGESPSGGGATRNNRQRNFRRSRTFSVFIGSLPQQLRVSAFKKEIRSKDVNPIQVVWRGNHGHAFLVFMAEDEGLNALTNLNDLVINKTKLRVEVANRSRSGKFHGGDSGDGGDEGGASGTEDGGNE